MIEKLKPYNPIIGDDDPYVTLALKDVPNGFHFKDLIIPDRYILTKGVQDRLFDYCEQYYRNYEICGITVKDWFTDLQLKVYENADNFEKFLEVYDDDIAKPVLGREVVTEHHELEMNEGNGQTENKEYDLPVDNGTAQEIGRTTGDNSSLGTRELNTTDKQTMSDIGVTNNWEKLNGFLDNNPTMQMIFRDYFKDCFTIYEAVKW